MRDVAFGLAGALIVCLVAASAVGRFAGVELYRSDWMIALWALAAATATLYLIGRRRWLSGASGLLHAAFIVILIGAAITHFAGSEGKISLYTDGPPADVYLDSEGRFRPMGAEICLEDVDFADNEASVKISAGGMSATKTISVNHPLSRGGMRIYLLTLSDERVIFLVTEDAAGRTVTYTGYLLLAIAAGWLLIKRPVREARTEPTAHGSFWLTAAAGGLLALQTAAIAVKWVMLGRPPMTDGAQALQIMAWGAVAVAAATSRRRPMTASAALGVGAVIMVAGMVSGTWLRSTPLLPALDSPLLAVHVVSVMIAYAIFAVMAVVSARGLISPSVANRCATLSRSLALPAVLLLCAGIFTGAVWANQAWGRYWGWDPKETWALVTLLVYALPFHWRSFPALGRPGVVNRYYLIAFITVLITYFGVNYLLGGLHAYM